VKNQYFGDRNDYFKYDLLIFLAEALARIKRLSAIWMLTQDDGSTDGGGTNYRRGAGNRDLFRFLQANLAEHRQVSKLKEHFNTYWHEEKGFSLEFNSYRDSTYFTNLERKSYFSEIPIELLQSAVVFLDPDKGLEVKSANGRDLDKYVKFEEVKGIYDKMNPDSCLVIYQHLPHVPRKLFLYSLYRDLREYLKSPVPISITDNQVAFLMIAKEKNRQEELNTLLHDYLRSNLQILD
jgi:hypothetical protein